MEPCRCNASLSVQVLHLHGCIGWCDVPPYNLKREQEFLAHRGGAIDFGLFAPVPPNTEISLDPDFLKELGCHCKDASLSRTYTSNASRIFVWPSYIKEYGPITSDGRNFTAIWAKAIQAIQQSSKVVTIGYSLPDADSATMTLFLGMSGKTVEVVNRNWHVERRIKELLESSNSFINHPKPWKPGAPPPDYDLSAWLNAQEVQATQSS